VAKRRLASTAIKKSGLNQLKSIGGWRNGGETGWRRNIRHPYSSALHRPKSTAQTGGSQRHLAGNDGGGCPAGGSIGGGVATALPAAQKKRRRRLAMQKPPATIDTGASSWRAMAAASRRHISA